MRASSAVVVMTLVAPLVQCAGPGDDDDRCDACVSKDCASAVDEYAPRRRDEPKVRHIAVLQGCALPDACEPNAVIGFGCASSRDPWARSGVATCGAHGYAHIDFEHGDAYTFTYDDEGRLVAFEQRFEDRPYRTGQYTWIDGLHVESTIRYLQTETGCVLSELTSAFDATGDEVRRASRTECPEVSSSVVEFLYDEAGDITRTNIDLDGDGVVDHAHLYELRDGSTYVQWVDGAGNPRSDPIHLGDCCDPYVCGTEEPVTIGPGGT